MSHNEKRKCCGKSRPSSNSPKSTNLVEKNDDGSILFDGVAPTKAGYVHDQQNPNRLVLDDVPCIDRITLPVLSNGRSWVMNQCNQIDCPTRGQTVDSEFCQACTFRRKE